MKGPLLCLPCAAGSKEQQSTFIHVATNSIHVCWQKPAGAPSSEVLPLICPHALCPVGSRLTPLHLTNCPSPESASFRAHLRLDVLATLSSDAATEPWLDKNKLLELTVLLTRLFPAPQNMPIDTHITYVMCGVIATRQVNAAAKLLGLVDPVRGPLLLRKISLLCLTAMQKYYDAVKPQLP